MGPAYIPSKNMQKQGSSCMSSVKGTPKDTQKGKKVKPYLKLMASAHLNMDYGVSVLVGPLSVKLRRFREPLQLSRQLLTTLFIH